VAYPFWFLIAPLRPLSGNDCNPDFDWAATGGEQIVRFLPVFSPPYTHYSLIARRIGPCMGGPRCRIGVVA